MADSRIDLNPKERKRLDAAFALDKLCEAYCDAYRAKVELRQLGVFPEEGQPS